MKLKNIYDYDLGTYMFQFEGSIEAMAYISENEIHVIQVYEHGVRLNLGNNDELMLEILKWFYDRNSPTWRVATFLLKDEFKQLMQSHLK